MPHRRFRDWHDRLVTLHVHDLGPCDGLPVLTLHGICGHGARWASMAAALPGVRLLAVDVRGHGQSAWAPPWGLEQHVADALEVLDARGLDRVAVLGHSFGAAIALHLARAAPERVERLLLLDPALGLDPQQALRGAEDGRPDETFPDQVAARAAQAERWAGVDAALVDAEVNAHLVPDGARWRFRYSRAAVVAAWGEMARPAVVPPTGMPTLLLPAGRVDLVRPEWMRRCRDALGDALTVVEIDAGHMLQFERPAEVAALVREFLEH